MVAFGSYVYGIESQCYLLIDVIGNRCNWQLMLLTVDVLEVDVLEVDVLVFDVLELDVLEGAPVRTYPITLRSVYCKVIS